MSVNEVLKLNDQVIESWNKHDTKRFLELCDESIVWKDLGNKEPYKGKKGAQQFFENWLTGFPDLKLKVLNTIANENSVAVELEFTGTNRGPIKVGPEVPEISATNKTVTNRGTYFGKVKNGKFTEVRTYPDLAGMLMQLGLLQEVHA